jgi:adenine deaminase
MKIKNNNWEDIIISESTVKFLRKMPKTELHVHIEGTLEADLAWELAEKKGYGINKPLLIPKPSGGEYQIKSYEELCGVYKFDDLLSFLNVYNTLAGLLNTKADFVKLAEAYSEKCIEENIRHAEIFFDPQTHTSRGIAFETVVDGLQAGLEKARSAGIDLQLIVSVLRDNKVGSVNDSDNISSTVKNNRTAWNVINCAIAYNKTIGITIHRPEDWRIVGVGLDNAEVGFPPAPFTPIFARAREYGLFCVAHGGEEGNYDPYIKDAIEKLKIVRLDHGVRAAENKAVLDSLIKKNQDEYINEAYHEPHKIPLTVCPLSNYKLNVFSNPSDANIIELLDQGLMVTVNSDDPAYFGGYVTDNYIFLLKTLDKSLTNVLKTIKKENIKKLVINGFEASILPLEKKKAYIAEVNDYFKKTAFHRN